MEKKSKKDNTKQQKQSQDKPKDQDNKPKDPDNKPKDPDNKPKSPDNKPKSPDNKPKEPDKKAIGIQNQSSIKAQKSKSNVKKTPTVLDTTPNKSPSKVGTSVKKSPKEVKSSVSKTKSEDSKKVWKVVSKKPTDGPTVSSQKKSKKNTIKVVLTKTQRKANSPHKDFKLSVEKVKKLRDKGYTALKEIGHGSYGKVYKAKSTKHKKIVAIKAIDLKRLTKQFLEKFLIIEIELMKKLTPHNSVTQFYEIIEGTDNNLLFISMEFHSNGDLFEYIIKRQFIPERQSCLWFKQLISGVQHIHKTGYAHRDLKCENILLNDKYDIKITDFGFCCRLRYKSDFTVKERKNVNLNREEASSKTFCGSHLYCSPELLRAQPYLPTKNDIWSCGVILYVMLFGHYPNDGHELEQFIQQVEHSIPVPTFPEVSNECKDILNNILVNEDKRSSIDKIQESKWFAKEWEKVGIEMDLIEYFENLNIPRSETEEFTVTESTTGSQTSETDDELTRNQQKFI